MSDRFFVVTGCIYGLGVGFVTIQSLAVPPKRSGLTLESAFFFVFFFGAAIGILSISPPLIVPLFALMNPVLSQQLCKICFSQQEPRLLVVKKRVP